MRYQGIVDSRKIRLELNVLYACRATSQGHIAHTSSLEALNEYATARSHVQEVANSIISCGSWQYNSIWEKGMLTLPGTAGYQQLPFEDIGTQNP